MATTVLEICNMALTRIGSKRLTNYSEDTDEGEWCRTWYEQTRDYLLRSHRWAFARGRIALREAAASPAFEWDYQFELPDDFMRTWYPYDRISAYVIEGDLLLTNDDEVNLVYGKAVTNTRLFDPLFVEALTLRLARHLCMPLSGNRLLARELLVEWERLLPSIRLVDKQETNTAATPTTWNDARRL